MAKTKHKTLAPTPEQAEHFVAITEQAIHRFKGDLGDLESAIGMYAIGRHFGWKVLYVLHSKKTIRKYEEILDIAVRVDFPEVGPDAMRSNGYRVLETVSNFWKAISGGQPIPDRRLIE
jgi:hypothetical protein